MWPQPPERGYGQKSHLPGKESFIRLFLVHLFSCLQLWGIWVSCFTRKKFAFSALPWLCPYQSNAFQSSMEHSSWPALVSWTCFKLCRQPLKHTWAHIFHPFLKFITVSIPQRCWSSTALREVSKSNAWWKPMWSSWHKQAVEKDLWHVVRSSE